MSENIRPLLNRFRGFEAPVRTPEDMRAMINDEVERMRTQDHVDLRIEARTIEMIVRLSESPISGEGYIPRSAFDLFDGVIADAAEHTDMNRPIEITHAAFESYVRTSWPRVAQRFGLSLSSPPPSVPPPPGPRVVASSVDPSPVEGEGPRVVSTSGVVAEPAAASVPLEAGVFTEERFVELIRERFPEYRNSAGEIHGHFRPYVNSMARVARTRWIAEGCPTVEVNGLSIPRESIVVDVVRQVTEASEAAGRADAERLRRAYERPAEGFERRGTEEMPDSLREAGRRVFEMAVRR
jgi:hypothetical protein